MRLRSPLAGFVAGVCAATVVIGVPAAALVTAAGDAKPATYDGTAPALTVSPAEFVVGASLDAAAAPHEDECMDPWPWNFDIPMRLRWTGSDATSGLLGYDVWGYGQRFDGWSKLVDNTSATSFAYSGDNYPGDCGEGGAYGYSHWVVAKDNRGNTASSALSATDRVYVWQESGASTNDEYADLPLTRTGTWTTPTCTCFNNGRTLAATAAGASLTYKLATTRPGQTVAIVMEKASNRGIVNVSVDGAAATAVNTNASTTKHRVIVWQKLLSVGSHTLKLTNAATAGRPRIDVDGILLSQQPTGAAPDPTIIR
jgi:hypothetical protein